MSVHLTRLTLFALFGASFASQYASFDDASATSVYGSGVAAGTPTFGAKQATFQGKGYWCSAGAHAIDDVVSWTGVLSSSRQISGISLAWTYSPGEYTVLVSPDGANFREAKPWEATRRDEVSFTESVMFEPTSVKVVSVIMRRPRAWGYYGLSSATVIAEPSPSMLVSGITSPGGSQCLVAGAAPGRFALAPCIDAVVAGNGKEIFTLSEDGTLSSAMEPDQCATVLDAAAGGELVFGSCRAPGVSTFELSPTNQLKLLKMGNYCVNVQGDPLEKDIAPKADGASMRWRGPADFTVSLGGGANVVSITVDWEFPAKKFELALSSGGPFTTLVASRDNTFNKTVLAVGGAYGRTLRLRMLEPASDEGFSIKSLSVIASASKLVAEDCEEAAQSTDARDKFFMVSVSALDPSLASATSATTSMAINAGNRLGRLTADLKRSLQRLDSCSLAKHHDCIGNCTRGNSASLSRQKHATTAIGSTHRFATSDVTFAMEKCWSPHAETLANLIWEARDTITLVRSRLDSL